MTPKGHTEVASTDVLDPRRADLGAVVTTQAKMHVAAKCPSDKAFGMCTPAICLDTSRFEDRLLALSMNRRRFGAMLGRIALLPVPRDSGCWSSPASESVYRGLSWDNERSCQVGRAWGNLRCLGADRKPLGALRMKIFSPIASRRNRRTIVAIFEVKKEIPARDVGADLLDDKAEPCT